MIKECRSVVQINVFLCHNTLHRLRHLPMSSTSRRRYVQPPVPPASLGTHLVTVDQIQSRRQGNNSGRRDLLTDISGDL